MNNGATCICMHTKYHYTWTNHRERLSHSQVLQSCHGALKSRVVITRDFVADVVLPVVCVLVLTVGAAHQGTVQGVGVRAGLLLVRERTRGGAAWTGTGPVMRPLGRVGPEADHKAPACVPQGVPYL